MTYEKMYSYKGSQRPDQCSSQGLVWVHREHLLSSSAERLREQGRTEKLAQSSVLFKADGGIRHY